MSSSPVTITVIYDNRNANPLLQEGWGLSFFIEFEERKILFDAGGDEEAFCANIEKLRVPFDKITDVVISHKHWDHVAGLKYILSRVSHHTNVYLPKFFPRWRLKREFRSVHFIPSSPFHEIGKNIFSFSLKASFLLYEQILVLSTVQGLILITGCAHPGILNIIGEAKARFPEKKIYGVIGGFHLYKAHHEHSENIVHVFQSNNVEKVISCHCSGEAVQKQFQEAYGNDYFSIGTGSVFHW